jgi:hypothetical protein
MADLDCPDNATKPAIAVAILPAIAANSQDTEFLGGRSSLVADIVYRCYAIHPDRAAAVTLGS